jgi:hypothetical protein
MLRVVMSRVRHTSKARLTARLSVRSRNKLVFLSVPVRDQEAGIRDQDTVLTPDH